MKAHHFMITISPRVPAGPSFSEFPTFLPQKSGNYLSSLKRKGSHPAFLLQCIPQQLARSPPKSPTATAVRIMVFQILHLYGAIRMTRFTCVKLRVFLTDFTHGPSSKKSMGMRGEQSCNGLSGFMRAGVQ